MEGAWLTVGTVRYVHGNCRMLVMEHYWHYSHYTSLVNPPIYAVEAVNVQNTSDLTINWLYPIPPF